MHGPMWNASPTLLLSGGFTKFLPLCKRCCFLWLVARSLKNPPPNMAALVKIGTTLPAIPWAPFQFHALVMATFASLVAPFGGFFASGFKRAFDIKDFGHSIPGHGGMTDRMDCQYVLPLCNTQIWR